MKITKIESCQIMENKNHPSFYKSRGISPPEIKIDTGGKDFVNIVFETDEGNRVYVDLTYRKNGNLGIDIVLTPQPTGKTYSKYIEIETESGKTIVDKYCNK